MKNKKFIGIFLLISFLFLSGCAFEIQSEIYLSDVYNLIEGSSNKFMVNSTIKLEILSEETFKENKNKITNILSEYFTAIDNVRLKKDSFKTFYVADVEIPFVKNNKDKLQNLVWFTGNKDGDIFINFDRESFDFLNDILLQEFFQTLEMKDLYIEIVLINDLRRDVSLNVQGIYVNNKPYPFLSTLTLKNRQRLTISFSNVLRDYLAEKGITPFVKIYW